MVNETSLSLVSVARMSDDDVHRLCCMLRWPHSDGSPVCPYCGCNAYYRPRSRAIFVCKLCARQFRLTTGTDLAYHKLSLREYVLAAILYAHHPLERNVSRFSSALGVQPRTATFLLNRFRMAALRGDGEHCVAEHGMPVRLLMQAMLSLKMRAIADQSRRPATSEVRIDDVAHERERGRAASMRAYA